MPTVLRQNGFLVRIYLPPREHPPAHVHVMRGSTEVVIDLRSGCEPPRIREVRGMPDRDVVRAYRIVDEWGDELMKWWRRYHA
jgi:hypothetical protein